MKVTLAGHARSIYAMAVYAFESPPGAREVHVALPEQKRAATRLEKLGLVTVRRTETLCAGFKEWWVTLVPWTEGSV